MVFFGRHPFVNYSERRLSLCYLPFIFMRLFLTSTGLEDSAVVEKFKQHFSDKVISSLSFLIISIQDNAQDQIFLAKTLSELSSVGVSNFKVISLSYQVEPVTGEYDVIYVCGGNTFDYLDRIRKTGLDNFITSAVKSGRSIYFGVSAGSILAGPDISIASQGNEGDANNISLQDLRGLSLINQVIFPHFEENMRSELPVWRQNIGYGICELADNQALYLESA